MEKNLDYNQYTLSISSNIIHQQITLGQTHKAQQRNNDL